MPPRRSSSGYRGVRTRPAGNFYVEIRATGYRLTLGTFETAHEAARAYDAAAWRLGRPRRELNFHDVNSAAQAEMLAPPPCLVTNEERQRHRQRQRRLAIAVADERTMAAWRENFPQDVIDENEFFKQQQAERKAARQAKQARKAFILAQMEGLSTIDDDDPWWADLFSSTASSSSDSDIEFND
ncbi:hypothetical protein ACQ4PT_012976 [Festuca glaucescens]